MSLSLLAYDLPGNIRAWKILAAMKIAGLSYTLVPLEYDVDNIAKEYLDNCHPMGRAPCLQTEEGYIFESNAILRHVARLDKSNSFLYGRSVFEASQVDQWLDYCSEFEHSSHFFYAKSYGMPTTAEEERKILDEAHAAFTGLDNWLQTRTYLAGERLTIADLAIASQIDWLLRHSGSGQTEFTKKYKNALRHYNTVMEHPKFLEVLTAQKAPIGLPKPGSNKVVAEKKTEEKKVNAPAPAPAVALKNPTAAPLIANFKKFAGDKSAYFMFINLEYTNDVCNFIAGPEGFSPEEILTLLTNPKECGKLQDAYCKIAKTSEKKMEKTREEIANLVNDFMDKKVGGVKELKEAEVKEKKAVNPETAALIAEFEAFVATQTQKHTTPKMFALVMDYLPEGFHPADIKTMLTNGEDCDELLETYVRLAVVPSVDKLRVRNELVAFVEAFAESKGIVHEEMCF